MRSAWLIVVLILPLCIAFVIAQAVKVSMPTMGKTLGTENLNVRKYGFWAISIVLYVVAFSFAIVEHKI